MASKEALTVITLTSLALSGCANSIQATVTPEGSTKTPKPSLTPTDESTSLPEPAITSTEALTDNVCIKTSPEERLLASEAFTRLYPSWKESYVTPEGAGGNLRVISPDLEYESGYVGHDTVSEGIGYGMILSSHADDKETFDGLWNYAKSHLNKNGLMSWRIKADNTPFETDSASDADLDIAYALYVASTKWGGYEEDLLAMLENITAHDIENNTGVLKPGDEWGGESVTSIAYNRPGYYPLFFNLTGNPKWDEVAKTSRDTLTDILSRIDASQTGLVPDWHNSQGEPVWEMGDDSYNFSWNATRYPWAESMAVLFYCGHPGPIDEHASQALGLLNSFFEKNDAEDIVAGYSLDGTPLVNYNELTFYSVLATAASLSENQNYREKLLEVLINHPQDSYFGDSLRMLALLLLSGEMIY